MNEARWHGHILHGSIHTKYPCTFQFHEPPTHKPVWVGWAMTLQPEDSDRRSHQTYKMSLWVFGSAINKPSRPRTCPVPAHPSIPMGSALSQVLQSLKKSSQALDLGDNTFRCFSPWSVKLCHGGNGQTHTPGAYRFSLYRLQESFQEHLLNEASSDHPVLNCNLTPAIFYLPSCASLLLYCSSPPNNKSVSAGWGRGFLDVQPLN